jgi:hypothetical protein
MLWPSAIKGVDVQELEVLKRNTANEATNISLILAVPASEQWTMNVMDVSLGTVADWSRASFVSCAYIVTRSDKTDNV